MRMLRGCPDCGATWREPTARFCGACGARLVERTDDTSSHPRRLHLPTAPQPSRILTGLVVIALVAAALNWAATRSPQIREIDVAVPGPTELQELPDLKDELPRCLVGGLEQDCVTWQLDARIVGTQTHGKLLAILHEDGRVDGINAATGEVVWSAGSPPHSSLIDVDLPGRVLVAGEGRNVLLDAATGQTIGAWDGWMGPWSDERFAVMRTLDDGTSRATVVDIVSGQWDEWELEANEHVTHVGTPLLSVVNNGDPATSELRAYAEDRRLLWSVAGGLQPAAVGSLVHAVVWDRDGGARILALEPATGRTVWASSTTYQAMWSSPRLVAGLLVGQDSGQIFALDPMTGEERWRQDNPAYQSFFSAVERPGEVVLVAWTHTDKNMLIGLDARTGIKRWEGPPVSDSWWDASRVSDAGLLAATGHRFAVHHWDGTATSFELTAPFQNRGSRFISLDPLVVSSGIRLYGIGRDIALGAGPQPSASE
jgi:outer membrane protein assembly factor BamB